jgi:hypothetical protein
VQKKLIWLKIKSNQTYPVVGIPVSSTSVCLVVVSTETSAASSPLDNSGGGGAVLPLPILWLDLFADAVLPTVVLKLASRNYLQEKLHIRYYNNTVNFCYYIVTVAYLDETEVRLTLNCVIFCLCLSVEQGKFLPQHLIICLRLPCLASWFTCVLLLSAHKLQWKLVRKINKISTNKTIGAWKFCRSVSPLQFRPVGRQNLIKLGWWCVC